MVDAHLVRLANRGLRREQRDALRSVAPRVEVGGAQTVLDHQLTSGTLRRNPLLSARVSDYPSAMASSVSGKIAFVTGGASGIGAALTTKLVDGGAEVWIADRQVGPAQELAQRLNSGAGKAHAIELDVRDYSSFERAVAEAAHQSGRIDYLFNNAGIGVGGEVDSYTLDDWNDVFDVNLRGVVHGIQAVYPIMIQQHSGHIVNTASMAGLVATPGTVSYTATKHAVVALSKALRVEAERHGVQVSVLCPGAIRTPILTMGKYGRYDGVSDEELLKFWEPFRPMAPEKFAERALHAVLRGDAIIVVPAWWKAWWYLERFFPALSMRAGRFALKRLREVKSTTS
jgi:NADP-dependent 3-hydroxy acid dehydrogenase YdfG